VKQLLPIFLSAVAIFAFTAGTPAVAQQMDPEGPARITAEPPHTPSHRPGNRYDNGPLAALGAIFAAPFDTRSNAITSKPANTTEPDAQCSANLDCSQSDYRGVP
jgi:hypothetical protein